MWHTGWSAVYVVVGGPRRGAGSIGNTGAVRLSAWICVFSSTQSTSARSGGFRTRSGYDSRHYPHDASAIMAASQLRRGYPSAGRESLSNTANIRVTRLSMIPRDVSTN